MGVIISMGLSNDLISQFVKITKDKTDIKHETTVYGTTVEYNDKMYVKLDGSDLLTPIETTTDTKAGERVTVMIKDHTATVTGNLSSPAARTETVQEVTAKVIEMETVVADKVSTKDLEAESARINTLVADNATIKDTLTATNAKITNLEAEDANISGKLTAAEADIVKLNADIANLDVVKAEDLEAINADIYNLEATYAEFDKATAEEFTAVRGEITNLDSKYATIDDLDAESARIDDLEATSLTATSATITDLQADVADIDTLIFGSASGNVIQSSFSNAVVAQLGNAMIKDAMIENVTASKITAGDIYTNNVRVLSEDGSLIISDETMQISDENRVRVQIGKDASNDYSINVWDADGNLMFSQGGITDSAIKEAIIRDEMVSKNANISAEKLDVGSMFTVINEDGSHTLNSSKVLIDTENQTLNVAFASMTTNVTTAQSTANTAQSSANNANNVATNALSAAINAQDDIDNLEIGGRNLYIVKNSVSGFLTGGMTGSITAAGGVEKERTSDYIDVTNTDEVTLQVWVTPTTQYLWCGYEMYDSNKTITQDRVSKHKTNLTAGALRHYTETITIPDGTTYIRVSARMYNDGKIKLEKGNKATDWTPAPEDVDADIASAKDTADAAQAQANTNTANLTTVTNTVTTQGTDISVLQGQISSKIWQQDITNAVTSIEVGSRNLLPFSNIVLGGDTLIESNGTKYLKLLNVEQYGGIVIPFALLETSTDYILHFDITCLDGVGSLGGHASSMSTNTVYVDGTQHAHRWASGNITLGQNAKKHIEIYFKTVASISEIYNSSIYIQPQRTSSSIVNLNYTIENLKLEKGNVATDWTPAPEDMATTTEVNTLSTKYSEVKQTVDGLTSTVASHTTQIATKADNTTVTTVNNKVSQLEQNIEGFKTTVSDTYSTKTELTDAVNNIEVGGRNYIVLGKLNAYSLYNTKPTVSGSTISTTCQSSYTAKLFTLNVDGFTPEADTYTLSGYIKVNGTIPTNNFINGMASTYGNTCSKNEYDSTTGYFEITQKYPGNSAWILHSDSDHVSGSAEVVTFEKLKFEKGNKATDWTPAPEDVDADITALETRMTTAETSITQTSTDITSLATRTTAVETKASNAYQFARRLDQVIDLRDTSIYDPDTYYPVSAYPEIPSSGYYLFEVNVQLGGYTAPWATHGNGFNCNLSCRMKGHGWGIIDGDTLGWIDDFSYNWCAKMPAWITQNTNGSRAVLYLRGGGRYNIYTNYDYIWTVHTETWTASSMSFSPTTEPSNHPNLVNNWDTVKRVENAETKIIQNADSITSVATRTTAVEDKFGQYSTTAEMNSAIAQKADSITSTVSATYTTKQQLENVRIGSTNYLLDSAGGYILTGSDQPTVSSRDTTVPKFTTLTAAGGNAYAWIQDKTALSTIDFVNDVGIEWAFSLDVKVTGSFTGATCSFDIRSTSHVKALTIYATIPNDITKDTWVRIGGTGTTTQSGADYVRALLCFTWSSSTVGSSIEYRNVQLEFGNKWSDWKQSTYETIQAVATAQGTADDAVVGVEAAKSTIEQLKDQISMLVVDGNNASLMTQTADGGWQFNMGTVNTAIDNLNSDVENVKDQADATDADVSNLDKRVTGLETVTEYVHIGTYTEPDTGAVVPSIDLGEGDSDFKLKITNKEIIFTNGSTDPAAHIDSVDQVFEIGQAEIRTDLRIGNIVFAKRPNGNVGISWKEA